MPSAFRIIYCGIARTVLLKSSEVTTTGKNQLMRVLNFESE